VIPSHLIIGFAAFVTMFFFYLGANWLGHRYLSLAPSNRKYSLKKWINFGGVLYLFLIFGAVIGVLLLFLGGKPLI